MNDAPLVADNVGRRYGRAKGWALRSVDLHVERQSILALVGPNGAGKSTLIRSWMGFERPNEGHVFVDGLDVAKHRTTTVKRTGYVPQSAALYSQLSVDDHFRLAASWRTDFDRAYADDRLTRIGVDLQRRVGTLSGGERAQVSLAIALGTRAPILLLDEPLASLDPLARREFLATLADSIRGTGTTVVLSSHIVSDVEESCDSLAILASGRLVFNSSVSDALAGHRTVEENLWGGGPPVGTFLGSRGQRLALVQSADMDLPAATLEEIVLGYIAAGRVQLLQAGF